MPTNPFNPIDTAAVTDPPIKRLKKAPIAPEHLAALPGLIKNRPVILPPKKAIMEKDSTGFPAPNSPYWKTHPLLTEHKDGSLRRWGEDTLATYNPNVLPKQMLPPPPVKQTKPTPDRSDKAKGYSSNYYTPNH